MADDLDATSVHITYIREALGRIEGKVDRMDQRLGALEQSKSYLLGAAAIVGAAFSFGAAWLRDLMRGK